MPCGEEAENLFLGELCWRFSSNLFHPLLSDFNLAFGIDGIGAGVRGEIWMGQPVNAREQESTDPKVPGMIKKPRRAIGMVMTPSTMKSPITKG